MMVSSLNLQEQQLTKVKDFGVAPVPSASFRQSSAKVPRFGLRLLHVLPSSSSSYAYSPLTRDKLPSQCRV
jgi:hypothetical protein